MKFLSSRGYAGSAALPPSAEICDNTRMKSQTRACLQNRTGPRREGFCLLARRPSEEHSRSYVTSERRSQKAKEPRPKGKGLRRFWAAPLLLVSHRPTGMLLPRASVQPKIDSQRDPVLFLKTCPTLEPNRSSKGKVRRTGATLGRLATRSSPILKRRPNRIPYAPFA